DLTLTLSGILTNDSIIRSNDGRLILQGGANSSFTNKAGKTFDSGFGKAMEITIGTMTNEADLDLKGGFITALTNLINEQNAIIRSSVGELKIGGVVDNQGILRSNNFRFSGEITNSGTIVSEDVTQDLNIII